MTHSIARRRLPLLAAILLAVGAAACKSKEPEAAPAKPATTEAQVARVDTCPGDGLWRPCVVGERVKRLGFDPKVIDTDTTRLPGVSPPGLHYQVGKFGLLIAFYFADSISAKKTWLTLDTLHLMTTPDTSKPWPKSPLGIRSGNLIAAFFGSSATQIERIGFALRAGVPAVTTK